LKIASVAEVKAQFSAYLKESEQGLVIVTRNGKPVAALLAVQDDEELERLVLAHSAQLRALLEKSRQQILGGRGISHEDFWREMEEETPGPQSGRSRKKPTGAAGKSSRRA
jgi:prevent-host-death family protein